MLKLLFQDRLVNLVALNNVMHYGSLPAFITVLVIWYLWPLRNSKSSRNPQTIVKPPMLPYAFPIIGHTIPFLRNSESLISYGREYFGNTRNIFSINLMGTPIYVLTDPQHAAVVHKNSTTFEFRGYLEQVLVSFGASQEAAQKVIRPQSESGSSKGHLKTVIQTAHELQVKQASGTNLRILASYVSRFLQEKTSADNIVSAYVLRNGVKCIPMKAWVGEVIICAMQDAYFGPMLHEIDPTLPKALMDFSDLAWQVWYQLPVFLRRKQRQISERIRTTHRRYLDIPAEKRKGTAWFTQALENEYERVNIEDDDRSVLMQFFHWGITVNPANTSQWLIAHISFDAELADVIRKETAPAIREDGSINTFYLANSCPVLESVWHETLRLYASVTSMRHITKDTQIGNNSLEKGRSVMFSARQLALNEQTFGPGYLQFDAYRFYRDPQLQHSACLRPFGGGKFICPGRHLAKHVICSFVAMLLHKFDISLAFPQSFPQAYDAEPSIGILGSRQDLYLKLKERS